jgi:hypothetical protein
VLKRQAVNEEMMRVFEGGAAEAAERRSIVETACNGERSWELGRVMVEVTKESSERSTVVEAGDRGKVEAMEGEWEREEGGVEWERKAEIGVNFVRNSSVQSVSIRAEEGLEGKAGTDFQDKTL